MKWDPSYSDSELKAFVALPPSTEHPEAVMMDVLADMFISDGKALGKRMTAGQYTLLAHGIELALKAYLMKAGKTPEELEKKFRHDLSKLLDAAVSYGLEVSVPTTVAVLAKLNKAIKRAKLRYEWGFTVPLVQELLYVVDALFRDLRGEKLPN